LNSTNTKENACKEMGRNRPGGRKQKEDDDGEGVLASLSVLSSVSALSPLFSVGVRLLSFISAFSSLSLYWFSSSVLPCTADFVCRTWSRDRKAVPACSCF